MNKKPLNILVINCDWRNLYETDFEGLLKKMDRYLMNTDTNNFFFFSWADLNYEKSNGERFFSVHKKTIWKKFRPLFDFFSLFAIPNALKKKSVSSRHNTCARPRISSRRKKSSKAVWRKNCFVSH